MPDKERRLTDDEWQACAQKLNSIGVSGHCSECNSSEPVNLVRQLTWVTAFASKQGLPYLALQCSQCGHTRLFNAVVILPELDEWLRSQGYRRA